MTPSKIALIAGLPLALSVLFAWSLAQSNREGTIDPHPDEARHAALEKQVAILRAEFDDAHSERRALAEEIQVLRAELDLRAPQAPLPEDESIAASGPDSPESETQEHGEKPETGVFDAAALLALGIPEVEVARLLESFETSQMEELYLRDTATREDWIRSKRFRNELEEVRNRLRNGLSDDDFDHMLYASGQKNRVVVTHVLHDSPALEAGLQKGDVVLRYNDTRISTWCCATTTHGSSIRESCSAPRPFRRRTRLP